MQHGPFGEAGHGLVIVLEPREKSSTADDSTVSNTLAGSTIAGPGRRPIDETVGLTSELTIEKSAKTIIEKSIEKSIEKIGHAVDPSGRLSDRPRPIARRGVACVAHVASRAISTLMQSARIERIRWSITRTAPAVESVAAAIASIEESSA